MSESSRMLRVLAVDDDSVSLTILSRKLQECGYQVAATTRATEALALLREKQNDYDIVITDIMMPEMDGFKLLEEIVSHEIVIPVILISSDSNVKTVVRGVKGGAQDYLVKPVQLEDLRQLGDHVMKKPESDSPGDVLTIPSPEKSEEDETSNRYETESTENGSTRRKYRKLSNRIVWTAELHKKFVDAVQQLQADDNSKIIPKNILEIMNEPNLRRENVASHLQKYRRSLMRQREVTGGESSSSGDAAISASISNTAHPTTNCYSSDSNGQYDTTGRTNNLSRFFEQNGTSSAYLAIQNAERPQNFLHSTSQIVDQMRSAPVSSPMLTNIIGVPVQVQTVDPRTRIFNGYTDSSWNNPYVMSRQQIPSVSSFVANNPSQHEYSYPLARIAPNVQPYNALTSNYQMHRGVPNQMLVRPQVDSLRQQAQCSLPGYHDVQNLCASGNFNGESQMNEFAGNEQIRYPELLQENPDKETIDSQFLFDELSALNGSDTVPRL